MYTQLKKDLAIFYSIYIFLTVVTVFRQPDLYSIDTLVIVVCYYLFGYNVFAFLTKREMHAPYATLPYNEDDEIFGWRVIMFGLYNLLLAGMAWEFLLF
jgi:hypothetical protein